MKASDGRRRESDSLFLHRHKELVRSAALTPTLSPRERGDGAKLPSPGRRWQAPAGRMRVCSNSSSLRPACGRCHARARRLPRLQQDACAHQYRGRDRRRRGLQDGGLVGRHARLLRDAGSRPPQEPLRLSLRHRHRRRGPRDRHRDHVHRPRQVRRLWRRELLATRPAGGHLRRDRHARFRRLDDVPHRPPEVKTHFPFFSAAIASSDSRSCSRLTKSRVARLRARSSR